MNLPRLNFSDESPSGSPKNNRSPEIKILSLNLGENSPRENSPIDSSRRNSPIRRFSLQMSNPNIDNVVRPSLSQLSFNIDNEDDEKISPTSRKQQLFENYIELSCVGKRDQNLLKINPDKLNILGVGNFGSVYQYDEKRVLKIIKFSKFRPEELLSCMLDNIHFVKINSFAYSRYEFRVLMSFVEGITLQKIFKQYVLSFDQLAGIVFQFIEILAYLDSIELLHNDLKPDNIILQENGVIKIIDYSLLDKKYVFATDKYSVVGSQKDIKRKAYQSDNIWTDAWSLAKSLWTYFEKIDIFYIFEGLPCKQYNITNEQCKMLSEFIRICLDFDEGVSISVLKSLDVYQYILDKGGIEFATNVLSYKNLISKN